MAIPTATNLYGASLPQQAKSRVTSKIFKNNGFKYPIDKSPLRGYFTKQSGENLIKNMIKTLIRTSRGERFMLPDYGCNVRNYLMEPLDEITFNLIKKEIQESISKYLKKIDLQKIRVFANKPSFGFKNVMNIQLFCRVKDDSNLNLDVNIKV